MFSFSRFSWRSRAFVLLSFALLCSLALAGLAAGGRASAASPNAFTLKQISNDPYTNATSQHKTQVEPDNYSNGSTIVAAVQSGRFTDGGASNTGWATSTNNGATWTHGFLPGTTVFATPPGIYARVSDPSVAYDAKHSTWLIASLAIQVSGGNPFGAAVIVNQSTNGGTTWTSPKTVATTNQFFDKSWIVCDDTASSPHYGNCYAEWDQANSADSVLMSTSSDGGTTWGAAKHPANALGLGGQPLVQPNGTVIVPYEADAGTISAFTSTNGGTSWNAPVTVAIIQEFVESANIRTSALPSAEVDSAGKVYVVWEDCRFEAACTANDIVMSTSTNGTAWSAVTRIPADAVGSGIDHIIPGIAVDKSTSGTTAHLALTYYYLASASCTTACQLFVGFVSSTDGGSTWTAKTQLAGPMQLTWLASTTQGNMVGDYISTDIVNGKAIPVFVVAKAPTGSHLHETLDTATGLSILAGSIPATSGGVLVTSGHPASIKPGTAL
jgi:BNR repeat-like domain